ncbi:MAG: phosphate acyltransferase PlsX [Desulfovibrio sp.]|jgi:glycerol-3-phosphate acyltransferase PlsX|nr:phosphate acyltransferase PlsX [Desulfovibrio sp.]
MGGDFGPSVVVPGALRSARETGAALLLTGDETALRRELARLPVKGLDVDVVHAPETVSMGEKPSDILRRKKDTPIQVACRLVAEGKAHGVVSPGHSGASVACGMFILGRVAGVERPALATLMPTEKAPVLFADVGANVDCRPHHLFQFGLMADTYAKSILNRPSPTIGLLSIGEEEGKGNSQVKEAYDIFKMAGHLNFIGNVEGRDLFSGNLDIIVCDGFVGNVVLKLSEGLSNSLTRILRRELLTTSLAARLGTFLARGAFRRFARFVDYAEYGGALLLGLRGIVIVAHGRSNAKAIANAVSMAAAFVSARTNERLVASISANEDLIRYGKTAK